MMNVSRGTNGEITMTCLTVGHDLHIYPRLLQYHICLRYYEGYDECRCHYRVHNESHSCDLYDHTTHYARTRHAHEGWDIMGHDSILAISGDIMGIQRK